MRRLLQLFERFRLWVSNRKLRGPIDEMAIPIRIQYGSRTVVDTTHYSIRWKYDLEGRQYFEILTHQVDEIVDDDQDLETHHELVANQVGNDNYPKK